MKKHQLVVLLFAGVVWPMFPYAQPDVKFRHYNLEQGLSQMTVMCMMQDSRGYIWIGTQDGLNRFDGYTFKIFRHDPTNDNSISGNFIQCLQEDQQGNIWVGTQLNGLNCYNPKTQQFKHYKHQEDDSTSLSSNWVYQLMLDKSGSLWIGNLLGYLDKFEPESQTFIHYPEGDNTKSHVYSFLEDGDENIWIGLNLDIRVLDKSSKTIKDIHQQLKTDLSSDAIRCMLLDQNENMWLGAKDLIFFDTKNKTVKRQLIPNEITGLSNNQSITSLLEDQEKNIWVGTQSGLIHYNTQTTQITQFKHHQAIASSLSNNSVRCLLQDRAGNIWVGTEQGINLYDPKTANFKHYRKQPDKLSFINDNRIRDILVDRNRNLWVLTDGGGTCNYNLKTGKSTYYSYGKNLASNRTFDLLEDKEGNLWVVAGNGLSQYNPTLDEFITNKKINARVIAGISKLLEDSQGNFWVGYSFYNPKTEIAKRYDIKMRSLITGVWGALNCLYEDSQGYIWFANSENGLFRFNPRNEQLLLFEHQRGRPNSLSDNAVFCVLEDHQKRIWIGTRGGLSVFNDSSHTFTNYSTKDGLSNNTVYGILEDDHGNLWLSTNIGINKFNPASKKVTWFDVKDGIQSNEFNAWSYHKDKYTGTLYFGGQNGITAFNPDSILPNYFKPPVVITDFLLFNKSVAINDTSNRKKPLLTQAIDHTRQITLNYDDFIFAFEFAALNYRQSEKNNYQYMLEGFDEGWIHASAQDRKAVFTRVPHGSYTFRVKGSNDDGIWSEKEARIRIIILPPWWRTWWAYCLYALVIIGLVVLIVLWNVQRLQNEKKQLEKLVNERTEKIAEQKDEILAQRDLLEKLFKEVNHRVKNNLQVVSSLLNTQLRRVENEEAKEVMRKSQNRIQAMSLIHQKLYQQDDITHVNMPSYIEQLLQNLLHSYGYTVDSIQLKLEIEPMNLDVDQVVPLGLIINELVSNTFKYAYDGVSAPSLYLSLEKNAKTIRLIVQDNGIGISPNLDFENSSSFGMKLVNILAIDQLEGKIKMLNKDGARWELTIPI